MLPSGPRCGDAIEEGDTMSDKPSSLDPNMVNDIAAAEALASARMEAAPGAPIADVYVPATAGSFSAGGPPTFLCIGTNFAPLSADRQRPFHWFVAVDLTTQLKIVANAVTYDNHTVPQELRALEGDPRYFLFVVGNNLRGHLVPQGDLYTFLKDIGSGRQLANLEQIVGQTGTGTIFHYSYVLAATMAEGDLPGFEASSDVHHVILTMQFMPIKLDDKIIYAPVQR
jgi:hypothetical protein